MSFLVSFIAFKTKLGLSKVSQCFSYMCPNNTYSKIYTIQNILSLVLAMSPWCPWCHLTLYPKPSMLNLLVPLIAQKESFHVEPSAFGVSNLFFYTHVKLFPSFGCSLLKFLYFCYSSFFIILGVVQVCFFVVEKA